MSLDQVTVRVTRSDTTRDAGGERPDLSLATDTVILLKLC